jgi:hypothetical protein
MDVWTADAALSLRIRSIDALKAAASFTRLPEQRKGTEGRTQ